jgi:hypothetical protein
VSVAHSPWLAALLMAAVAAARGVTAARSLSGPLTTFPIVIGFMVVEPPATTGGWPAWLSVGLVVLVCAAWATLVMFLLRHQILSLPRATALEPSRARLYGLISGLMVGCAAWFAVTFNLQHTGGWLMLTIVVVFEPYVKDGYVKALHRAGGTILGFVIAFFIGTLTQSPTLLSVAGVLCLLVAVDLIARRRPYWQYAAFLTPAVVLLAGANGNVFEMDGLRLAATLTGVALVLVVIAVIRPFAKRRAEREGVTHY